MVPKNCQNFQLKGENHSNKMTTKKYLVCVRCYSRVLICVLFLINLSRSWAEAGLINQFDTWFLRGQENPGEPTSTERSKTQIQASFHPCLFPKLLIRM